MNTSERHVRIAITNCNDDKIKIHVSFTIEIIQINSSRRISSLYADNPLHRLSDDSACVMHFFYQNNSIRKLRLKLLQIWIQEQSQPRNLLWKSGRFHHFYMFYLKNLKQNSEHIRIMDHGQNLVVLIINCVYEWLGHPNSSHKKLMNEILKHFVKFLNFKTETKPKENKRKIPSYRNGPKWTAFCENIR